MSSRKMKAV